MADFRQFYGIDLPLEAEDVECARWGLLWHALPRESRTARRQFPDLAWSEGEHMLNQAVYYLHMLEWRLCTKDGKRGIRAPQPQRTPGERADAERRRANAESARADIDRILGIPEGARKWQST